MSNRAALASFAIASLVAACGGKSAPAPTEPATREPAPTEPAASGWAAMTRDQKMEVMKKQVVPAVAAIWKESPKPDEKVDCLTCHGDSVLDGTFTMPNPELPKLTPKDNFAAHADEPEWLEFMSTKLLPTMRDTLGVDPYDPNTHEGFGCLACHELATE